MATTRALKFDAKSAFTVARQATVAPDFDNQRFYLRVRNADGGATNGISDAVVQIFPKPSQKRLFFHPLCVDRAENKGTRLLAKLLHSEAT
jgi:hypothetical protein